jgi:hypothetical protein
MNQSAPAVRPGIVDDAATVCRTLALPNECRHHRLLRRPDGEVVIWYGGWDFETLSRSGPGTRYLDKHPGVGQPGHLTAPGYYRLHAPLPGTRKRTWHEQLAFAEVLGDGWWAAPILVLVTAALTHLAETGSGLFQTDVCRCAETPGSNRHLTLCGQLRGITASAIRDTDRNGHVWLAAAKKV